MSHLISWIELPNGEIKYVTGKMLFETEQGKVFREQYPTYDDFIGHECIRKFYHLERLRGYEGEKECADFSTPANFPAEIAQAIKNGEYRGLISVDMLAMLAPEALTVYELQEKAYAAWRKAYADWRKADATLEKAYADWRKACADWRKADAALGKADATLEKAYATLEKACAAWRKADAALGKAELEHGYFWDVFADPINRIEAWR